MNSQEKNKDVENEIRRLLKEETRFQQLSNSLFAPGGLFGQLASSKDERRTVAQSALFKDAQERVVQLRRGEAEKFAKEVDKHLASREQRRATLEQAPNG